MREKMKKLFCIKGMLAAMFAFTFLFALTAMADGDPTAPVATEDFLKALFESIGKLKGAGTMGIVVVVVQLLMLFFRTPLANFAGKYRLLIASALTMVGGVIGLKLTGVDWMAALVHSSTLAAFQVFGHQAFVQFIKKADEQPSPTTTTK